MFSRLRQHRAKIHMGQNRDYGLRQSRHPLNLGLLVERRRPFVQVREGCVHARSLLLPLFQLRLLLLRWKTDGGKRHFQPKDTGVSSLITINERFPFLLCFCRKNASAGKREAHEKEKAAGGAGAAATPVAGAVLRARERVEFHEHGGDEEQPEGRGVEPRLRRQAQRHYTRADQHLPGRHALLHRRGRIHSAQVGRLVLCGYVRNGFPTSPFHSNAAL